jgi:UDP-N-acetylglucosamine--N-acetylmuramyl-(pentapeptide) pyrophosphoryl-undecaprenol N-acetylglucosamine transferase
MTTLMLATTGGHLTQLHTLASRLGASDDDVVWVTHDNEQSRSLLADFDVEFVPYVRVRNVPDVMRCVPHARRLLQQRKITRAISTGSGIALGYLPFLAARGVACHYIESAARVEGPSITGTLMRRAPRVVTYSQYRHWSNRHWLYRGSLFDGFEPTVRQPGNDAIRVVVTVGTAAEFPFRRLVDSLLPLLGRDGRFEREVGRPVEVVWQTGCTPVDDLPITANAFMPAKDLIAALERADVVVSHAGTGSALAALAAGHQPILVSREQHFGEAGDDHQRQLAMELSGRGLAADVHVSAIGVEDLMTALLRGVQALATPPQFELCL